MVWLIGLGVQPIVNRAYRPTDNAIVERNHQTWQAHVLEGVVYATLSEVQVATERAFADRREALPSRHRGGERRPFLKAYPDLVYPRRVYTASEERDCFKVERLDAYLSAWRWRRMVDRRGQISLGNSTYKVGEAYHGQSVRMHFDTTDRHVVYTAANGQERGRMQVPELEVAYILDLEHH